MLSNIPNGNVIHYHFLMIISDTCSPIYYALIAIWHVPGHYKDFNLLFRLFSIPVIIMPLPLHTASLPLPLATKYLFFFILHYFKQLSFFLVDAALVSYKLHVAISKTIVSTLH